MNFMYFVDERLRLALYLFDLGTPPFQEIKRKIEAFEPPYEYHGRDNAVEDAYQQAFEDADTAIQVIGMSSLGLVQTALHEFLKEFVERSFGPTILNQVPQIKGGPALPSAYLIRLRLKLDIVDAKYVLLFLLSPEGEEQLLKGRTATAQPNINSRAISDIQIPLPKLEVQQKLVCYIEKAFLSLDQVEAESTRAFSLLSRLEQAALAKAFRGELSGGQHLVGAGPSVTGRRR